MKEIPVTQERFALIDDCDESLVRCFTWELVEARSGNAYAQHVRHKPEGLLRVSMHRLVAGAPTDGLVDHKNGNGLDNRRQNLRICSALENARNRAAYARRKRADGGYLGVSWNARARVWVASIHAGERDANGEARRISLRTYATAEEAARMYDAAASHYFGEFAAHNFPGEPLVDFDPSIYSGKACGEQVRNSKLTDGAVRAIRASNENGRILSTEFGVSATMISRIRRRLAWAHVA